MPPHSPEPTIVSVLSFIIYLIPILIAIAFWYYVQHKANASPSEPIAPLPHHPPSTAQAG